MRIHKEGQTIRKTCLVSCLEDRIDVGCVMLQEGHNEALKDELRSLHVDKLSSESTFSTFGPVDMCPICVLANNKPTLV